MSSYNHTTENNFTKISRAQSEGIEYFYEGDIIKLYIPVPENQKISAGSYVLIDQIKVYPTASKEFNGFVEIQFKNAMDYLLKRDDEAVNIQFAKREINVNFANVMLVDDTEETKRALNFSPLGVKLRTPYTATEGNVEVEYTPVRFGTVWYFDDLATTNCWSRGDGMGTLVIRPRKMFYSKTDNDFYNYVVYVSVNGNAAEKQDAAKVLSLFNRESSTIPTGDINTNASSIISLLNGFSKYWAEKGENEETTEYNCIPSFGKTNKGIEAATDTPADFYYYVENENDKYVMEYSAVLHVPSNMYGEPLLAISYVSYVKGSTGAFVPESQAPYNVYLLGKVDRFVAVSDFVEYNGVDWINAVEFGLVGDGVTLNDDKMDEYIKYYSDTPIYFPNGVYCFEESLDFPDNMYIELDPSAELRCVAKEPLEFFITVRKDSEEWIQADEYSKSYIKGGTINANYCAKTALAVCQCYHTQFEGFTVKNVLEKGIQTSYNTNDHKDGSFVGRDLIIYNDGAIKGTVGIYDNGYNSDIYNVSVINCETGFYSMGGRFYECAALVDDTWTDFENVTFAHIGIGTTSVFTNCTMGNMRYGFKLDEYATCAVTNMRWYTKEGFYDEDLQKQYPQVIFWAVNPATAQFHVNGVQILTEGSLSFSNGDLPKSSFINVRIPENITIDYVRNDSDPLRLQAVASITKLDKSTHFNDIKNYGIYACDLTTGSDGTNAPNVNEKGVLQVKTTGDMIVQKFCGTNSSLYRVFDGISWGQWIVIS